MNRLDKIKQEFLQQFTHKLKEEKIDLSVEHAFDVLVSSDPSPNKKNVRWLIQIYLHDGYLWEDISSGEHSKVHDTLNTFIRNKNKLDIVNRSINRYQSIADMWKMVKQYAEDKSGKEIKRAEYDRAMNESELVVDNDDLKIVVPLTEYASKFHGRGTRWCTAGDNDNRFWEYAKDAPLFIIMLKETGDKLQLWKNDSDVQFMDEDDKNVSRDYVEQNWNVLKDIITYTGLLRYIPEKYISLEMCEITVKQNGRALEYVPDNLRTPELCQLACKQTGWALKYVPDNLRTYELCQLACKQNGMALKYVPDMTSEGVSLRTYELCKIAVEQNGWTLPNVPDDFITQEFCDLAIKNNATVLYHIPNAYKTKEICKLVCEKKGENLRYVPKELITYELCKIACKQNGMALKYVPDMTSEGVSLKTYELCKIAVQQNGLALEYIPDEFKTYELCKLACNQGNQTIIEYVPEFLKCNFKNINDFNISIDIYKQDIEILKRCLS